MMMAESKVWGAFLKSGSRLPGQNGVTIVELMLSIAIGMLVILAGITLLLSARTAYLFQDDATRVQDTGRYALEVLARAIRQSAYENRDDKAAAVVAADALSPSIRGFDAASLKNQTDDLSLPSSESVNGSDVLTIRFFGAGGGTHGDGTVVNCAGFGVPAVASPAAAEAGRGWNIFHVAKDAGGEPELHCKYRGENGWMSQAVARGVESFQVLYGIDLDDDGVPNRFMRAAEVDALDARSAAGLSGKPVPDATGNGVTHWKKIVVVRVAILVRGTRNGQEEEGPAEFDLFGRSYADAYGDADQGTRIRTKSLPRSVRNRLRKIYSATIQLRNPASGAAA